MLSKTEDAWHASYVCTLQLTNTSNSRKNKLSFGGCGRFLPPVKIHGMGCVERSAPLLSSCINNINSYDQSITNLFKVIMNSTYTPLPHPPPPPPHYIPVCLSIHIGGELLWLPHCLFPAAKKIKNWKSQHHPLHSLYISATYLYQLSTLIIV